jgi:Domain of unknown function (DUF4440)
MHMLSSCLRTSSRTLALATSVLIIGIAYCAIAPYSAVAADAATQNATSESLRREILAMDERLSEAYAACRTQRLGDLFARDAEMIFGERGRLHGVAAHVDEVRRADCAMHRETTASAQWIEALPGHTGAIDGAIQFGVQTFCARDIQPCRGVSTRFVAIWHRTDAGWKITQLIRYDYSTKP